MSQRDENISLITFVAYKSVLITLQRPVSSSIRHKHDIFVGFHFRSREFSTTFVVIDLPIYDSCPIPNVLGESSSQLPIGGFRDE